MTEREQTEHALVCVECAAEAPAGGVGWRAVLAVGDEGAEEFERSRCIARRVQRGSSAGRSRAEGWTQARACRAAAVPLFSPHDLRHRRISLLHLGGVPWARIGEAMGQRSLAVTADTYTHVLADERELDYAELLAE